MVARKGNLESIQRCICSSTSRFCSFVGPLRGLINLLARVYHAYPRPPTRTGTELACSDRTHDSPTKGCGPVRTKFLQNIPDGMDGPDNFGGVAAPGRGLVRQILCTNRDAIAESG